MKASKFTDAQKAFILKQAEEGVPVGDICRKAGISQATFYCWRKKYAGMTPPEMRRLKALEARIEEICETRVWYGVRRVHVQLRREGWEINHKKTHRIYRELGLQLRNKTPKRRVKAKLREDRQDPGAANETWAMDFVHDQLATGRKLRVLTIVDTFSRFSPAVDPRFSCSGEDVVRTLEAVCAEVGRPKTIRVDNVLCREYLAA